MSTETIATFIAETLQPAPGDIPAAELTSLPSGDSWTLAWPDSAQRLALTLSADRQHLDLEIPIGRIPDTAEALPILERLLACNESWQELAGLWLGCETPAGTCFLKGQLRLEDMSRGALLALVALMGQAATGWGPALLRP